MPDHIAGQLASILETAAPGGCLGQLTAVDPDPNQTFAYAIVGGSGIGDFVIDSGGQVTLAPGAVLDFETTPEETVVVRATDAGGLSVERVFNIAVLDGLDIISGTTGPNNLVGTAGPDSISALAGDDTIRPGGGDDFIDGGPGSIRSSIQECEQAIPLSSSGPTCGSLRGARQILSPTSSEFGSTTAPSSSTCPRS